MVARLTAVIAVVLRSGCYSPSLCHMRDRAFVAVYDATKIPDGSIAKIWLDHHVPITFHGTFARD